MRDFPCNSILPRQRTLQKPTAAVQASTILGFQSRLYAFYQSRARVFPWRETSDPYRILVSEIMLQQTQTERVLKKFEPFLLRFPDFPSLARSDLRSVLQAWQGLGYNRRAVALKEIAGRVLVDFGGVLPDELSTLMELPGIGRSTAGAILAFAHNVPIAFIETNIRRVFIHFFFSSQERVRDSEILALVEQTMDRRNPRHWYYALMDYGSMLKETIPNPNRRSAHYTRQGPFEGSNRQIRGRLVKRLLSSGPMEEKALCECLGADCDRISKIVKDLEGEGFLKRAGNMVFLG